MLQSVKAEGVSRSRRIVRSIISEATGCSVIYPVEISSLSS